MKRTIPVLALSTCTLSPALAQTSTPTFSGPHIGVSLDWNRGTDRNALPGTDRERRSGVAVSGNVGYDIPIGESVVIGPEASISTGNREITTGRGASHFVTDPGLAADATTRFGVKPTQRILVFAKGGWGFQRVRTSLLSPVAAVSEKNDEHGLLWGAGTEFMVARNIALRSDYDRVKFNDRYTRERIMSGVSIRF